MTASPTITSPAMMTGAGVILGTAAYMSPEQARGKAVDKRSDIWAFGCVLYEMLTSRRAFEGDEVSDALVSVLSREPDWTALPSAAPPVIVFFLRRCLQKDPKQRVHDIADVRLALDGAFDGGWREASAGTRVDATRTPVARSTIAWIFAAIAAIWLTITLVMVAPWRSIQSPATPVMFGILPGGAAPLVPNANDRQFDISPDGTRIVYASGPSTTGGPLAIRELGKLDSIPLSGITNGRAPFFSPDGEWIGFFDLATVELRKVPAKGGPSITLFRLSAAPRGAIWAPDDTIIFATSDPTTGLVSVPASGGEAVVLTRPDPAQGEAEHLFPSLLPNGRGVLFTVTVRRDAENAQDAIAVLELASRARKTILQGGSNARYVETGHLLYTSGSSLYATAFDADALEIRGVAVPIINAVGIAPTTGAAQYTVSPSGTLAFMPPSSGFTELRAPVWVDRAGSEEPVGAPPRTYFTARLSPDGTRAVLDIRDRENSDAWIWNFRQRTLSRLTFTPEIDFNPVWTPDGRRVVTGGTRGLFVREADGTGTEVPLTSPLEHQTQHFPMSFTPDGHSLLVAETNASVDLALLTLGENTLTTPLINTPFQELVGEISPDGRWLAYESNESGRFEVYVRPFPNTASGRWQISRGGGMKPAWAKTGRELFHLDESGGLIAVPIQTAGTFVAGSPTRLFETRYFSAVQVRSYDVAADGRFLMLKDAPPTQTAGTAPIDIIVVLNWFEELKRLVPTN